MSLLQTVKSLICLKQHIEQKRRRLELLQRLLQKSVVAEEILGEVERNVREYEEEGVCLKQLTEQKSRILKLLLQPVIKLHRAELQPWIEKLILRYDGSEQLTSRRRLKAHVVGVGHMSQSQAQTVQQQQGTTQLIFLSDGVVQVPAILTASALEDLQEREDMDSQSTLVHSTVHVLCRVDFYMHPRQDRSGFFLSVSKLATVAAGPPKGCSPPCTTLASVRQHVCNTWRLAQTRQDSVHGSQNAQQHGFDLSQLLWTWDHDALHDVQMDALTALQPSTSSCHPAGCHADAHTSWEADRIAYKSAEPFVIPVCRLLIPEPEEEAQRPLKAAEQVSSETPSGFLSPPDDRVGDVPNRSQAVHQMAGHLNAQTFPPETVETLSPPGSQEYTSPQENTLKSDQANPWDAFSPPMLCTPSSRLDESITPEAIPPKTPTDTVITLPNVMNVMTKKGVPFLATSTQVSSRGSSDISQTPERSKGEQSSIHPYQKPKPTLRRSPPSSDSSTSESSAGSVNGSLNLSPRAKNGGSRISTHPLLLSSNQENPQAEKETGTREEEATRGKRKRKFHHCNPDVLPALEEEEEGRTSNSPPTWLFESQKVSTRAQVKQKRSAEESVLLTVQSTVHSDGAPLSYAYADEPAARERLLQELFKFKVSEGMLRWAVDYLKSDVV